MSSFKVTAKRIRICLEEMSKDYPSRHFTCLDIACKLLNNHYGIQRLEEAQVYKATQLVRQNLASMLNANLHSDILKTDSRIDSMNAHYPKIKKSIGYRIGEVNGNIAELPVLKHSSCNRTIANTAMKDAIIKAQEEKDMEDFMVDEKKEVKSKTYMNAHAEYIQDLSYYELSELIIECIMRRDEMFEEASSVKSLSDKEILERASDIMLGKSKVIN